MEERLRKKEERDGGVFIAFSLIESVEMSFEPFRCLQLIDIQHCFLRQPFSEEYMRQAEYGLLVWVKMLFYQLK